MSHVSHGAYENLEMESSSHSASELLLRST